MRYVEFVVSEHAVPVICEFCDSMYLRRALQRHETAHCTRCGALLYRASRLDIEHLLALTVTTAVVFVIANASSVIRISVGGLHSEANLLRSVAALSHGTALVVGLIAATTLFVVPLLQIVLLGWVLLFARERRRAPGFGVAMRVLHIVRPWSMTEVFLLGVLVAIVKLSGMLHVISGPGAYATVALTFLTTLIARRDLRSLWAWLPPNDQPQR
jgi:paraquat-inducible protein A